MFLLVYIDCFLLYLAKLLAKPYPSSLRLLPFFWGLQPMKRPMVQFKAKLLLSMHSHMSVGIVY